MLSFNLYLSRNLADQKTVFINKKKDMKFNRLAGIVLTLICVAIACSKENNSTRLQAAVSSDSHGGGGGPVNCDLFAYPDTIFYPQTSSSDYIVMPVNVQNGK